MKVSKCCGANFTIEEIGICEECGEHTEVEEMEEVEEMPQFEGTRNELKNI